MMILIFPLFPFFPRERNTAYLNIAPQHRSGTSFDVAVVGFLISMDGGSTPVATAAGNDTPSVGRVRKRAPEACTFCRRRKARR
jgi:hypothetical protein